MTHLSAHIRNLSFRYRGQQKNALDKISLELKKGDFLVVMGPTEAGKSTLAACLNGLIPHFFKGRFEGDVTVLGKNTRQTTVAQMSEHVGIVFQDFEAQLFSTSVELEVAFGPESLGLARAEIARSVDENLELVGLLPLKGRSPATLSGGQKQKLAIASVLALSPAVMVMDEPTTDLDPESKREIFRITGELRQRNDMTLVVVEHETEEVVNAEHVLLLKDGEVVAYGRASDVLRRPETLAELGVMPIGMAAYFSRMGADTIPLTVDEALSAFRAKGWRFSEERHCALGQGDSRRSRTYGGPLIECRALEYEYPNGVRALEGIDLTIQRGEMVAIIGQNGGGKTSLVKHFNALLLPTRGTVTVEGQPTSTQGLYELGQKVGYVFQNPDHQIFCETVFDEVAFGPRQRKVPEDDIKRRVEGALQAVGLAGFEKEDPFTLTKSGRKRVAVASVLALEPEVLVLDEPSTGLDYAEQRSMMELVKRLNEQGRTIIFVTHHMWIVAEYAHRIIVVKDGKILMDGPTREILAREEELAEACLRVPQVVAFSNALGRTALSVDELVSCTQTDGAQS